MPISPSVARSIRFSCLAGLVLLPLAGCSVSGDRPLPDFQLGADLAPIPGSITYKGQPRSKLTKAPIGSTFDHEFRSQEGLLVHETYMIQPDRSLKIVSRRVFRTPFGNDDP